MPFAVLHQSRSNSAEYPDCPAPTLPQVDFFSSEFSAENFFRRSDPKIWEVVCDFFFNRGWDTTGFLTKDYLSSNTYDCFTHCYRGFERFLLKGFKNKPWNQHPWTWTNQDFMLHVRVNRGHYRTSTQKMHYHFWEILQNYHTFAASSLIPTKMGSSMTPG